MFLFFLYVFFSLSEPAFSMNQHQQIFGFFNLSTDINQVVQKLDHNQTKKNLNEQQIQQIVTEQFQVETKIIDAKNQELMNQFTNQMQKNSIK